MSRIGILTFHYADNCGALLQLLALTNYLEDIGYSVEVIDYQSDILNKRNAIFQSPVFRFVKGWKSEKNLLMKLYKGIGGIVYSFKRNLKFFKLVKERRCFNEYRKKYIKSISKRIFDINDLNSISEQYDCIIVGSDQLWNTELFNGTADDVYFMNSDAVQCKKITYAISAGDVLKMKSEQIKYAVRNFDIISVREEQLCEQLRNSIEQNVTTVLDPVFLCPFSYWNNIGNFSLGFKYIFLYVLETNTKLIDVLNKTIKNMHDPDIKVIEVGYKKIYSGSTLITDVDPIKFLSLIKGAEYVISNSFHATAFSIIFHKEFYSIKHSTRNARIENLLLKANLYERMVETEDDVSFEPISYSKVFEFLESEIKKSKLFLSNALEA